MREHRTTGRGVAVRVWYFCYFAAQGCMASYLNVYLQDHLAMTGDQLGLFHGLSALVPVAVLPFVGWWADRTGRSGWLLTGSLAALVLGVGGLGLQRGFAGALGWGMLWETARSLCVSLADRQAVALGDGARRYGGMRAFGSLGFLLGGSAMGLAAGIWGLDRVLFPTCLCLGTVCLAVSFALHHRDECTGTIRLKEVRNLFRNASFRMALVLGTLGSVSVSALQPYLGSMLVTVMGAGEQVLTVNTLCCVVPEMVLLPLCTARFLPRWGFRRCFLFTTLACALRCIVYALAPGPEVFLAGSLLYGVCVCGYTALTLTFLRAQVPPECCATAILANAAVSALGRAVCSWCFGLLYQHLGCRSIFALLALCALGLCLAVARADCLKKAQPPRHRPQRLQGM